MRRRLLVISHVWPFPGASGQQRRVRYTLEVASADFEIDFLTVAPPGQTSEVRKRLQGFDCRPLVLESCSESTLAQQLAHSVASCIYSACTGLKASNYLVGKVELSPRRIAAAIRRAEYDAVLYEYFHAVDSVDLFRRRGVPTILDTHNILWKSVEQRLRERREYLPASLKRAQLSRYRKREEQAWTKFDGLIAINRHEHDIIRSCMRPDQKLFYAPMGTDLARWPFCPQPGNPPRLGYYGPSGLHNEAAALRCHDQIMPRIWKRFPDAEFWLIGGTPSEQIRSLTRDRRVKVTGFVEQVQEILATMSAVLCPWSGTYGFRSRLVEVMALGVPVVATPAAVDGMELESGRGIILAESDAALADGALKLLSEPEWFEAQSRLARAEMERLYSLDNTYGRLITELKSWLDERRVAPRLLTTDH